MNKATDKKVAERNEKKRKKPDFLRQDGHKKKRLDPKWVNPRGKTNKVRLGKRGYRRAPENGWGSPAEARGLSHDGKRIVPVKDMKDLAGMKEGDVALIPKSLGARRRFRYWEAAKAQGKAIFNIDIASFLESKRKEREERHALVKTREEKRKKKPKKTIEESVKDGKEGDLSDDEKKKRDKEEKDRVLTKRE